MKKLFIILVMMATATTAMAQSQLSTIRGKTKNGKTLEVKYYKGTVEDYVESVKYQVLDELQSQVKNLQAETRTIQGKLDAANKRIKELENKPEKTVNNKELQELREQVTEKETQIVALNDSIATFQAQLEAASSQWETERQALRSEIATKDLTIQQLNNRPEAIGTDTPSPVIGVEGGFGIVLPNSRDEDYWVKDLNTCLQADLYFGTASLSQSFPLSFEVGVGFRRFSLSAHLHSYEQRIEGQIDNDGDPCTEIYTFSNLNEKLTVTNIDIPIRLCFGQPYKGKTTAYAKLGVTPSINLGSNFEGEGSYSRSGYYEQWGGLTLEDIAELDYGSGNAYQDVEAKIRRFNLWGTLALGAYVPLSKSAPIVLNAGLKLDYSFMPIGTLNAADAKKLPDCHTGLLQGNGRMLVPSFEIGIVYTLK